MTASTTKKVSLDFVMQHQVKLMWCWSAVGTSCALFYAPDSGWTQCKLAAQSIQPPPGDCCAEKGPVACDQTWFLENPDQTEGSFITTKIARGFVSGAIPFSQLMTELDAGRPVAFRLKLLFDGHPMYHFVVVAGYALQGSDQEVTVYDPYLGNAVMPYNEFTTQYKYDGQVTHSFFTEPPTTA